jgi:enoyl-CoA hydratase/carnithine racemase
MTPLPDDGVEYSLRDGIGLLRVNRPEARNALNWAAQEAFASAVSQAAADAAGKRPLLRALIVTGAGDQAFVSGGDLKELADHPEPEAGARLNRVMSGALAALTALPAPVIGAVNGDAIGGGCEILTACDLRLTAAGARFCFRQVHNGLTSGWGGGPRLVELIGQARAMELMLTARMIDADEALRLGLVHRIAPPGTAVIQEARAWAGELLLLPREALAAIKQLVHAAAHLSPADAARLEARLFVDLWPSADHLEALAAFNEKRPPRFNRDLEHDAGV